MVMGNEDLVLELNGVEKPIKERSISELYNILYMEVWTKPLLPLDKGLDPGMQVYQLIFNSLNKLIQVWKMSTEVSVGAELYYDTIPYIADISLELLKRFNYDLGSDLNPKGDFINTLSKVYGNNEIWDNWKKGSGKNDEMDIYTWEW